MKIIFSLLFILSACSTAVQKDKDSLSFKDLEPLRGNWTGTQSVLLSDDSTRVSLPTVLLATALRDSLELNFTNTEPDGQQEKEKGTLSIHKDGNKLSLGASEYDVLSVKRTNDELIVIARKEDEDNDKQAEIRFSLTIGPRKLMMLREVKYKGTEKYLVRIKLELAKK